MVGNLAAAVALLVMFGITYNHLVEDMQRSEAERGYMSFIVVIGVAVTVSAGAGFRLYGWDIVATLAVLFLASGTPMILGSVARHQRQEREEAQLREQLAREVLDGQSKTDQRLHMESGDRDLAA